MESESPAPEELEEEWPETPTLEPQRIERRGAWVAVPTLREEELGLVSRLLIVWVGSGAGIISTYVYQSRPDLLLNNVNFWIDSNKFNLADLYRTLLDKIREEMEVGYRPVVPIGHFKRCFIKIGDKGAGKNPDRGFKMFQRYSQSILHTLNWAFGKFNCEGAAVVFALGGGTGTKVGPFLAATLARWLKPTAEREGTAVLPICTLPLRANPEDLENAIKGLEDIERYQSISGEPSHKPLVLDLETIASQLKVRRLPEDVIYEKCDHLIATLLGDLFTILQNRRAAKPSWDWSDLYDLMAKAPMGSLGTIMYVRYDELEQLERGWRRDLPASAALRGLILPEGSGTLFMIGAKITKQLHQNIQAFLRDKYQIKRLLTPLLVLGNKYEILTLYWGISIRNIKPELKPIEAERRWGLF